MIIETEIPINASAEKAWMALGEQFGDIAHWAPTIVESSLDGELGVGCVRSCRTEESFGPFKASTVKEKLLVFDRDARVFEYQGISGLPGFVKVAKNRWSIHADGDQRCVVKMRATLELKGIMKILQPLMPLMLKKDLKKFKQKMKNYVEGKR